MSRLFAILSALLLAQGCASFDDPLDELGVTSAGESGQGTTTQEPEEDVVPTSILECELPVPCELPFEGKSLKVDAGAAAYSVSDLCALSTLQTGELALVQTATEFDDQVAFLDYAVIAPGVALQQAWGISDVGGQWQRDVVRCELQPAEFFAACAAAPSGDCFDPEMWVRSCAPLDILVCPG